MTTIYTQDKRNGNKWEQYNREEHAESFAEMVERAEGWARVDRNGLSENVRVVVTSGQWREYLTDPEGNRHRITIVEA